ncbi:MAG TPA: ATP-binding protein [Chthoniobacterales bacterium]|jgi:hypothetical protein
MAAPSTVDETILILAPLGRDAELASMALSQVGYSPAACRNVGELVERLSGPCGAAIIAEESLASGNLNPLTDVLRAQPPWSDLPVIILTNGRDATDLSQPLLKLFSPQGNITLLERPLRIITLRSMVEVALRARRRQYQVRDLLNGREQVLASERAARTEAEKASRMKDEFLATLSHELRTPLNAILGWASILRTASDDPEELEQGLEIIERNARTQSVIIDDLLDMSRIISGKINLDIQKIELSQLVEAAVKTVSPAAAAREIDLRVVHDSEVGAFAADPNRLQQVFYNLLTNAIKFTPNGGAVCVTLRQEEAMVDVSISDCGIGIEAEFLPLVFDRFRQANASSTRKHGGLGLGLAIVKSLVELHGGSVRAESPGAGLGSTFIVTLPMGHHAVPGRPQPVENIHREPAAAHEWKTSKRLEGVRLLVVDDEPDSLSLMKRLLQDSGALVRTAGSAAEAFQLFQMEVPEVLVSDIGMPVENGYSLIRRIRALSPKSGGNVPAVAVTAYARAEDREHAREAGFNRHTTKPVDAASLLDLLVDLSKKATSEMAHSR